MDKSEQGFILFSLGTNVRSDNLNGTQKDALIRSLGRLKENVLWKYESDIKGLPKNIITRKWLPQNEILGNYFCFNLGLFNRFIKYS